MNAIVARNFIMYRVYREVYYGLCPAHRELNCPTISNNSQLYKIYRWYRIIARQERFIRYNFHLSPILIPKIISIIALKYIYIYIIDNSVTTFRGIATR